MATNVQIGKYLYNRQEMGNYGKLLGFLTNAKNGAHLKRIVANDEIVKAFGGDESRAQVRVSTMLRTLKMRNIVADIERADGVVFKIANEKDAAEIIQFVSDNENSLVQRTAEAAKVTKDSADVSETNNTNVSKEKKKMSTKTKTVRMFRDPTDNTVKPFGIGRPSKAKMACEVAADGKYLDPQAAAAFLANGAKADDKLTKTELLKIVAELRAENELLRSQGEQLAAIVAGLEGSPVTETVDETVQAEVTETAEDSVDADDGLEVDEVTTEAVAG